MKTNNKPIFTLKNQGDFSFPTKRKHGINLTPLIDVLFVIILFLSLVSDFKSAKSLDLDLPTSVTAKENSVEHPLVIDVSKDLKVWLNGVETRMSELPEALENGAFDKTIPVLINMDSAVPHGFNIGLMDALRKKGFNEVSFGTR